MTTLHFTAKIVAIRFQTCPNARSNKAVTFCFLCVPHCRIFLTKIYPFMKHFCQIDGLWVGRMKRNSGLALAVLLTYK